MRQGPFYWVFLSSSTSFVERVNAYFLLNTVRYVVLVWGGGRSVEGSNGGLLVASVLGVAHVTYGLSEVFGNGRHPPPWNGFVRLYPPGHGRRATGSLIRQAA